MALAGCGGSTHRALPRRVASATEFVAGGTSTSAKTAPPKTAPPKTAPPRVGPGLRALRAALPAQLGPLGAGTGAYVYDISAGRTLFAVRATETRPPASVEKLFTSVAVLSDLGSGARLQTAILGTGHLGPGGIWHGNLYVRGGGDPTFGDGTFNRLWEDGYGPTANRLVAQLSAQGIRRVTGAVIGDASLFDSRRGGPNSGFAPDIPDLGGQLAALTYDHGSTTGRLSPVAFAVKELVLTMRGAHIAARAARFTARTPPVAQQLASVSSPPMSVLLKLMDVPSDDFFAEMLTKQLGVQFGNGGTTAAGAAVISQAVAAYGLDPNVVDGSGLSRSDRTSPEQVVDLLRSLWQTPTGRVLDDSLPVVGVSGTVQTIAVNTAAQGRCIAKTGTLDDVTNLAGYCHARGGHVLAFALFVDGPPNWVAIPPIGQMVAAIAKY